MSDNTWDVFWMGYKPKFVPLTCASRGTRNKKWLRRISRLMICLKRYPRDKSWKTTPNIEGARVACYTVVAQWGAPSMLFARLLGQP